MPSQAPVKTSENKLGTMAIGPLLTSMSLPIVLSMLVQALYNVVDSIFVAHYSETALAAVSLVFPVQNLMIALGAGTAVGVGSLLSRRLGEKNFGAANAAAQNGVFLALASWLLFALLGLLFSELFFAGYIDHPDAGAEVARQGAAYMRIVTVGSVGTFMGIMLERLLQSTGRALYSMVSQMTGAVLNILLDPLLIFGLLGFPRLGVAGAALATIIGQVGGMLVAVYLNLAKNKDLHLRFGGFRPDRRSIGQIYAVGLPSILMQSIGSVMVFVMNRLLAGFGLTPVSVFGIYFKLQSFVILPVLGFNTGMIPIVAYNYGARRPARITKTIRLGVGICFCFMLLGTAVFWLFPAQLLGLFNATPEMLAVGSDALRSISLGFPFAAITIPLVGVFQALGRAVYSLIGSVVRQLVFLLPLAWLFSTLGSLHTLWFAFPIAELAALLLALYFFRRIWLGALRPLYESTPL